MIKCPSCSREILDDSRHCSYCGALVEAGAGVSTVTTPPKPAGIAPPVPSGSSSDAIDQARFTPGTMLTERYRIVGLLGKGGMGEVYRADDLKLRQSVALKFLPAALSKDPRKLERFHHEVRVARQVSHPNVCRVYDIGEAEGQPFISMEYVDGEDLASVLRRMGKPSPDKALQIARQLCAGLAAAHDKGVLHRDLKPHNVMIDGRGKVRITDFGLAGFIEDSPGKDVAAGTPAYMAPEQLAGREVSVKSDVYSLGLVLFELFAGKRLFEGATREQIDRLQSGTTPTTLSGLAEDIDPAVERVIQRCLEIEPSARPSSALAVAAALPGGDPLAAALAAGETPDPEMVAAAGEAGGLRPTIAWAWLATLLGALILGTLVSDRAFLHQREALEKPPQVLADRASNLIRKLGYTDPPQDSAHGFIREPDYMRYVRGQARSPDRQDNVALGGPQPISFWYRQSPHLLVAVKHIASTGDWSRGAVSADDPPPSLSGMVAVRLDPRGRLLQFRAVPTQVDKIEHQAEGPDWLALFAEAGLDMARFEPVTSTWTPPVFADTRAAWKGSYSEDSEIPIRVEAAACRGKPVYFHVLGPWTRPERDEPFAGDVGSGVAATTWSVIWLAVVIGAAVLGVRNLRLGRADRRGAAKLAVYVLSLSVLTWLFKASHVPDFSREQHLFTMGLAVALQSAIRYCFYYLALEPYARKLWPQSLIAWSRVLAGRFRDPLVGRDLLIGGVFGVSWWLLLLFVFLVASWLGSPPPQPPAPKLLNTLLGGRYVAAVFLENGVTAVFTGLAALMLFLLLRVVLRRQWLAIVVFLSVFTVVNALPANHYALWLGWALVNASFLFLLLRFGLFAAVAGIFVSSFFATFPVTFDFSAWYIGASLTALVAALALGVYGFHTALAGRPLVEDRLLEA